MLEEAISYPKNSDSAVRTLLVGGILTLLSFLIVPVVFVLGYLVRVLRTTVEGATAPPAFDEWETLLRDGLKALLVTLGYLFVPVAILVFGVVSVLFVATVEMSAVDTSGVDPSAVETGGTDAAMSVLIVLAAFAVGGISLLVASYALPAGLAAFATTDRVGAAFAFRSLWPVLTSGSYLVAWLLALVVSFGAGVLIGTISLVPVVGAIAGVFVYFYANVAAFRLYGCGYADATDGDRAPERTAGQSAA